jgi:hypothetical protein
MLYPARVRIKTTWALADRHSREMRLSSPLIVSMPTKQNALRFPMLVGPEEVSKERNAFSGRDGNVGVTGLGAGVLRPCHPKVPLHRGHGMLVKPETQGGSDEFQRTPQVCRNG